MYNTTIAAKQTYLKERNMCGGDIYFRNIILNILLPDINYRAFIIRHETGHEAFCVKATALKQRIQMRRNLIKSGACIVAMITGTREQIVFKVRQLNHENNLPGIYSKKIIAA